MEKRDPFLFSVRKPGVISIMPGQGLYAPQSGMRARHDLTRPGNWCCTSNTGHPSRGVRRGKSQRPMTAPASARDAIASPRRRYCHVFPLIREEGRKR